MIMETSLAGFLFAAFVATVLLAVLMQVGNVSEESSEYICVLTSNTSIFVCELPSY